MANRKIEKELYGPSVTEVALGAVLGLLLGVVVAGVYLVFKPVATVKQMPAADKIARSVVYYLPGSDSSTKGREWPAKQKAFIAGTAVSVSEDELNIWASSGGTPPPPPKPVEKPKGGKPGKPADKPKPEEKPAEKPADKPAPPEGFLIPAIPNFRVAGDKVQIGMKCTLNVFSLSYDTTVLATGTFRKSGDQVVFAPDTIYLGSCPLHLLPAASGALVNYLVSKQKFSDEMRLAWTKLTGITVEGGVLKFAVQ